MSTLNDSQAAGVDVKKVHEVSTDISVDEGRGQVELLCEDKEDREESSVKAEQGSMKIKTEELPSVRSPCQSCDPGNVLKVAQEADQLQQRNPKSRPIKHQLNQNKVTHLFPLQLFQAKTCSRFSGIFVTMKHEGKGAQSRSNKATHIHKAIKL